jgi:arginyl-tRNA synthetase
MILPLHDTVRARVRAVLAELYSLADPSINVAIEEPPNRTFGDLGVPVAFELARRLRKAPRVIAHEIAARFTAGDGIQRVERRRTATEHLSRSSVIPALSRSV